MRYEAKQAAAACRDLHALWGVAAHGVPARLPVHGSLLVFHGAHVGNMHEGSEAAVCIAHILTALSMLIQGAFHLAVPLIADGHSEFCLDAGSHRPLGMEGWRFAFLSLACVSAATGVANLLLATDPLRDQPPLSAAHALSKSGRVSAAELELLQPGSVTGAATGQQLATPCQHGESEAEALSRRQPHDSASSSCARQQPALAGSFPAFQGSQSKQRWCAAMGPAARQIAADIWSVLRIPTFGIIVAQVLATAVHAGH